MSKRKELDKELRELLGTNNVYFQPPSNVLMKYPCIVYSADAPKTQRADDRTYFSRNRYTATYIRKDPDDELPNTMVEHFLCCSIDRNFTSDNMHHTVLTIYY